MVRKAMRDRVRSWPLVIVGLLVQLACARRPISESTDGGGDAGGLPHVDGGQLDGFVFDLSFADADNDGPRADGNVSGAFAATDIVLTSSGSTVVAGVLTGTVDLGAGAVTSAG